MSTTRRVLVVEDDASARSGMYLLLQDAGYECSAIGTFKEAAEILRNRPPDLLITDVRLGEYNGLQLVLNRCLSTAAIVITGYDDSMLAAEARRHGAAYLVKPIRPNRLLELAQELLAADDEPMPSDDDE